MANDVQTLVVDDEAGIRFFVKQTLERVGHHVTTASSGEEALAILRDHGFDLVMLDLKLGGSADGLRVLEAVHWRWPETVIVILTAHGSLESAMTAIEEGVDRYLLKPLTPEELREAVQEVLSEAQARLEHKAQPEDEHEVFRYGPFEVDVDKHQATRDGTVLDLTPSEFDLLVHLIENAESVIEPPTLVKVVRDYDPATLREARNIIKWYIHQLRQKIEPDPAHPRYVVNVRGVGYRFGK